MLSCTSRRTLINVRGQLLRVDSPSIIGSMDYTHVIMLAEQEIVATKSYH